ncbi:MAG TPA: EscU/YscU/HrcU family type III secretion system export apparatus switch protein [Burkholderiaceae bacterium]|nr:EscU/YscU/HrcU family type III secretion system export apparatus switch protein [Burkholderiaceae bacterium]
MAEQEQNRSEPASPFKLREAKKRGSVAKSMDLNSVFVISALLVCLQLWAWPAAKQQLALAGLLFQQSSAFGFSPTQAWAWLVTALVETMLLLAPFFAAVMLAGALSSLVQHGPVFSVHPIKPDFSRLNPATGFKRLFSRRALFDLVKNLVKLAVFTWVLYLSIVQLLPSLLGLLHADAKTYAARALADVAGLVFKLLLALLAIALLDLLYTRWEYSDKLRMSRRELKDEVKQREGNPKIKARIRELQNELRKKSQAVKNIPKADVLVTNPTHLGVALVYRHGQMAAPVIVAKGVGDMVEKMKAVARRHRVTIVENRRLARALYGSKLHEAVPEEHYAEVARLLVWIQEARKGRSAAQAGGLA